MFLGSSAKPIDDSLKNLVDEIEAQSPGLMVLTAREFRYSLRQTSVEVTIKEPRPFNVLEEFIIRAGIELDPPPKADELASVLGLDPVFVRSAIATLQTLQTLDVTSLITVTPEGRLFYEKGSVPQPPESLQIYAIADPLGEKLSFHSEPLNDVPVNLPDLADFINTDNTIADISSLSLEEIQQSIQASGLGLHVPKDGKFVISCRVIAPTKIIWKKISLFVIYNVLEDKLSLQLRSRKQILESASNLLEALQSEGKISLQALCELSNETITFECEVTLQKEEWLGILPVWLNVVLQGLKSKNVPDDSVSFKTALSLLSQVSDEEAFIESLRQGWRQVIGAIATNNFQAALNLLSDEVWQEFLRLAISQPPLDTPEKFIAKYTASQTTTRRPQKRRQK
ncbi:hypothetical protein [Fischerella sp. PCC 9605]|uniref:hypothetical protein n=1 Tax=Fischerella sp. PCC 9605 TaxID=1173024 RepID=UPI00047DCF80|nr:hypothetical protein [Fischerella sp. PCC 9605]